MGTRGAGRVRIVVLDTNILVSALGWRGPERLVYERCGAGVMHLATSPELLDELERVLRYPKFLFTESEIQAFLREVTAIARLVHPRQRIDVVQQDPDDNRVLECAVEAEAEWIVSGDPHLLELGKYKGIQILSAAAALRRLAR